MNIIDAIRDPNLFGSFFDDPKTWRPWRAALRTLYGIPRKLVDAKVIQACTGRDPNQLPSDGFNTALFLTGRRSGKSRIAATIGAYEAVLAGHETKLARGEQGLVAIIAPTRHQGSIVLGYLRGIFTGTPMLAAEVVREAKDGFELRNGIRVSVLSGDYRTVRGFTLVAAIVDEIAFFGLDDECRIRSDTELVRALKPGLATCGGRLVCISSPYAKRGWCYRTWKTNHANDSGRTLVWNCPSRTMNPTLPQAVVDDAMAEDMQAAKSEYLGEFRDDVAAFVPRDAVERLVAQGRTELLPRRDTRYFAFVDVSGGRGDDATLAIAHKVERKVILDRLCRWRPPFNPHAIIAEMARELERWGLRRVTGDNYSAEFVASSFRSVGVHYVKATKPKSELYRELLPRIFSEEIELIDDAAMVDQLANLERRTRSGGKDVIDHPQGGHDDLANAVAGVADLVAKPKILLRAF